MNTYRVIQAERFEKWLDKQAATTRARINARLVRAADGNFGDHHGVGDEISEMRLDFGPGYRLYYTIREGIILFLLLGGDKSGQRQDIERAKDMLPEALKWLEKKLKKEREEQ